MASYAKITLIGNAGNDPQVREVSTQSGPQKVADVSIAVNTRGAGGAEDKTDWYRVSFWGRQAEIISQYVKKGNPIFIEGRLSTREYMDKENRNRTSLEVRASDFQLLGTKADNEGGGDGGGSYGNNSGYGQGNSNRGNGGGASYNNAPAQQSQPRQQQSAPAAGNEAPISAGADDDLPF